MKKWSCVPQQITLPAQELSYLLRAAFEGAGKLKREQPAQLPLGSEVDGFLICVRGDRGLPQNRLLPVRRRNSSIRVAACAALPLLLAFCASRAAAQNSPPAANALPDAPGFAAQSVPAGATIAGTVVDPGGDVLQGAQVVLTGSDGFRRVAQSGEDGQFVFSGLPAGTFTLTVSGAGHSTVTLLPVVVAADENRFLPAVVLALNTGVTEVHVFADQQQIAEQQVHIEETQRVLGVVPNFYTSFDWHAAPMDAKQKFQLAFRDLLDPIAFAGAAAIAGGEQIEGIYSGYGTGIAGYGKRFGAAYANDFDAKLIGGAVLPSLFHQDPRYFYKGTGSTESRALYAVSRAVLCRGNNGRTEISYSHILASFAAGGMSNLYYPQANRGASLVFINGAIEIAGSAGTNLIREFILRGITTHADRAAKVNP